MSGLRQSGTGGVGVTTGSAQRKSEADQEESKGGEKRSAPAHGGRCSGAVRAPIPAPRRPHQTEIVGLLPSGLGKAFGGVTSNKTQVRCSSRSYRPH